MATTQPGGLYTTADGALVDANGKPSVKVTESAASPAAPAFVSDLADDFPGRTALAKLEMNAADVDALDRDGLIALKGIGETTADEILALRA